jgi:hypothetical protein
MANCKRVEIKGKLDKWDVFRHENALSHLGWLSLPDIGLKIKWERDLVEDAGEGRRKHVTPFMISGVEGVSEDYIIEMIRDLRKTAEIEVITVFDIDAPQDLTQYVKEASCLERREV